MSISAIRTVLELLPAAFHRVTAAGDIIHAPLGLASGTRGLLLSLERAGPTSVSRLAAMRPVSRQYVQKLIDDLIRGGWVEAIPNPRHKRSPLIRLTQRGRAAITSMEAAETPYLSTLGEGLDSDDLAATARVLSVIYQRISQDVLDNMASDHSAAAELEQANG